MYIVIRKLWIQDADMAGYMDALQTVGDLSVEDALPPQGDHHH